MDHIKIFKQKSNTKTTTQLPLTTLSNSTLLQLHADENVIQMLPPRGNRRQQALQPQAPQPQRQINIAAITECINFINHLRETYERGRDMIDEDDVDRHDALNHAGQHHGDRQIRRNAAIGDIIGAIRTYLDGYNQAQIQAQVSPGMLQFFRDEFII